LATNVYECLFILDSNRYARDARAVAGTIPKMVEKVNGEMLASRLWVEQRLAYPIKGHRKGTYWLTYFRMDSSKVADFNRACRLNDNVLRSLVIRVDPRLVDVLVAHALGKSADSSETTEGEGADQKKPPAEAKEGEAAAAAAAEAPAETAKAEDKAEATG
jgi:small subunit ribosomal protein S6